MLASTLDLLRSLRTDRRIARAVLANAWFWMAGSAVVALLPGLVRGALGGGAGAETVCLCLFAMGIACGSALASFLSGGRTVLLPAGLGCAVLGLALVDLWRVTHGLMHAPMLHAGADLFAAAAGGGLLAVPTQAAIQALSPPERRARTVAASNVAGALGMVLVAALLVAARLAGLREPALLGLTGLLCLPAAAVMLPALSPSPWSEAVWVLFRVLFRIRLEGAENLPRPGEAALLLPNHVSWLDATALFAVTDTPPLFAIDAHVAYAAIPLVAYGWNATALWPDSPSVAVALPDPRRGERIVLPTERVDATRAALQRHLHAAGTAELMLPASVHVVERPPLLGSGKPDLAAAGRMAASIKAAGVRREQPDREDEQAAAAA